MYMIHYDIVEGDGLEQYPPGKEDSTRQCSTDGEEVDTFKKIADVALSTALRSDLQERRPSSRPSPPSLIRKRIPFPCKDKHGLHIWAQPLDFS